MHMVVLFAKGKLHKYQIQIASSPIWLFLNPNSCLQAYIKKDKK